MHGQHGTTGAVTLQTSSSQPVSCSVCGSVMHAKTGTRGAAACMVCRDCMLSASHSAMSTVVMCRCRHTHPLYVYSISFPNRQVCIIYDFMIVSLQQVCCSSMYIESKTWSCNFCRQSIGLLRLGPNTSLHSAGNSGLQRVYAFQYQQLP